MNNIHKLEILASSFIETLLCFIILYSKQK